MRAAAKGVHLYSLATGACCKVGHVNVERELAVAQEIMRGIKGHALRHSGSWAGNHALGQSTGMC